MIVEPDLIQHWKFRLLARAIGKADAFQALLGLWGYAQARRQWIFRLDPATLAAICDTGCSDDMLWELMTQERSGWLVPRGGGWWEIRGWADTNRTLTQAWTTKTAGRLPWMADFEKDLPEDQREGLLPPPSSKPGKRASAGGSPDPSYDTPKRGEENGREESESEMEKETRRSTHTPPCSIDEARQYGLTLTMGHKAVDVWWHVRNAAGWRKGKEGVPIHCWQSDLESSKSWAEERAGTARLKVRL